MSRAFATTMKNSTYEVHRIALMRLGRIGRGLWPYASNHFSLSSPANPHASAGVRNETNPKRDERIKSVLYRALEHCPGVKSLYTEGTFAGKPLMLNSSCPARAFSAALSQPMRGVMRPSSVSGHRSSSGCRWVRHSAKLA